MLGIDIVSKARIAGQLARFPERFPVRVLHPRELAEFTQTTDKVRFLAGRWAAKEALAKALGTGLRAPVHMKNIWLDHDELGAPQLGFAPELAPLLAGRRCQLSLSDERDLLVAVVLIL